MTPNYFYAQPLEAPANDIGYFRERLKGEMKGKRNEASHPRLDIMFFHKRHK